MGSDDLLDHGQRIAELERKVAELYRRIGQAEPLSGGFGFTAEEPATASADADPRLIELIESGQTINAIKLYRELTGLGLAEAKDAVERLEQIHRPIG